MAASTYQIITKEVENQTLETIEFLDTRVYKQPTLSMLQTLIFLCKYYEVISDTLVCFFLYVLFLLMAVILSELYEKPRRNKD